MNRYIPYLKSRQFHAQVALALGILALALVVNFYAGTYATEKASNPVSDVILDNIPVFDVDQIFIYGALAFGLFIAYLCIEHPKRLPFTLNSISLFVYIRAIFVSLTHLAPYPNEVYVPPQLIFSKLTFGADLFFSGHTGLPFLLALIYWKEPALRYLFLATSIFFGIVVLMGHLHYSIDVLSAFFITYTIYDLALFLFKKEKKLFDSGLEV